MRMIWTFFTRHAFGVQTLSVKLFSGVISVAVPVFLAVVACVTLMVDVGLSFVFLLVIFCRVLCFPNRLAVNVAESRVV